MFREHTLTFFQEMVSCSYSFYFWTYNDKMQLLNSNCPEEFLFETVFSLEHFKELILTHIPTADKPVLLSNALGLMWAVVFEPNDNESPQIHVMGPAFITSFSYPHIENRLNLYHLSVELKCALLDKLHTLPVIETNRFLQYVLMFHFFVRNEKLTNDNLQFLTPDTDKYLQAKQFEKGEDPFLPATADTEHALLFALEHGNLNYTKELSDASLSASIKVEGTDSFNRYKYPCYRFISLCCKAACEGGLSRYISYTLSNDYCEAVDMCKTPTELKKIMDTMYEDYVRRVHQCQKNAHLSKPVQVCCDFIRQNPTGNLSIETLAAMVGYTPYYLSKKFKKELGITIGQFIKKERIEYARLLLSGTNDDIQQISELLHFCSNSHFSEAFHAQVGMLPREYRKTH